MPPFPVSRTVLSQLGLGPVREHTVNTSSTDGRDPLELLAEEFAEAAARGSPTIGEYEARYPDLADEIRHLFPALVMIEDLGQVSLDSSGAFRGRMPTAPAPARRLPPQPDHRPGRHGRGLRGRAGLARPPRGGEGAAAQHARRSHAAPPVRAKPAASSNRRRCDLRATGNLTDGQQSFLHSTT